MFTIISNYYDRNGVVCRDSDIVDSYDSREQATIMALHNAMSFAAMLKKQGRDAEILISRETFNVSIVDEITGAEIEMEIYENGRDDLQ